MLIQQTLQFINQMLQFIANPQNSFVDETVTTLQYIIIPTVLAMLISIPLGILVAQRPVAAFVANNLTGAARAIPTLAFLIIAIRFLGIGFTPVVVGLTVLGIPPILLNTIAGLRGIDPATIDAGRGMGMTAWELLIRVRVPLVLPVIAAGVRTSAVQIVATTPFAALVGGMGYGDYILFGLDLGQTVPLFVGAICVAVLALATEVGLGAVQRVVTPAGLRVREIAEVPETRGADSETRGGEPLAA
ncbi:MAG: ABC transporter permease [Ktedonobacterales bacterium]